MIRSMANDIVFTIDISLSMKRPFSDMRPSKISTVLQQLSIISNRIIKYNKDRIGIIAFYNKAVPLLHPTNDIIKINRTLSMISKTFEGSAPGDAIIEAVKILRNSIRNKRIIMITDGDYNAGIPLDLSIIYAINHNVDVNILTLGLEHKLKIQYILDYLNKSGFIKWYNAESRNDCLRILMEILNISQP